MLLIPRSPRWTSPDIEEVIAARGGLFCLVGEHNQSIINLFNTISGRFDRYVDFAESSLYRERPRRISYGIMCSSDFNAFACSTPLCVEPPLDFIGINVGVIFTLIDCFSRILAQPASFPEVGDPSLEDASRCVFRPLTTNVMSLPASQVSPLCPVRSIFATTLAQTALDFLFFHELAHLRNGHCEYYRENIGVNYVVENFNMDYKNSDQLIQQTLEMDADSGAVLHTLNEAFKLKDMLQFTTREIEQHIRSALESAYGNVESATKTVAYSAYVLFRLFDDSKWDAGVQSSLSHPQPSLRMSWIGATIFEIFSQRPVYRYNPQTFAKNMVKISLDAETDCGRIQGLSPDPSGIMSVYSTTKSLEYLDSLKSTWSSIKPYLEKYKRGGKLPD